MAGEEWVSEQDRDAYEQWPRGECKFWFLLDEANVRDLAAGTVSPELQARAVASVASLDRVAVNDA